MCRYIVYSLYQSGLTQRRAFVITVQCLYNASLLETVMYGMQMSVGSMIFLMDTSEPFLWYNSTKLLVAHGISFSFSYLQFNGTIALTRSPIRFPSLHYWLVRNVCCTFTQASNVPFRPFSLVHDGSPFSWSRSFSLKEKQSFIFIIIHLLMSETTTNIPGLYNNMFCLLFCCTGEFSFCLRVLPKLVYRPKIYPIDSRLKSFSFPLNLCLCFLSLSSISLTIFNHVYAMTLIS